MAAATKIVADACEPAIRDLEAAKTKARRAFVEKHGIDSTEWRASFTGRYPARDQIFDELTAATQKRCKAQLVEISGHLASNAEFELASSAATAAKLDAYRANYLKKRTAYLIQQVREEATGLESVLKLKAKVGW